MAVDSILVSKSVATSTPTPPPPPPGGLEYDGGWLGDGFFVSLLPSSMGLVPRGMDDPTVADGGPSKKAPLGGGQLGRKV